MYTVIVNPKAGTGRASRAVRHVETALSNAGKNFRIHQTESRGHATRIAADAPEGVVVVVGGDGTVNEAASGILGSERTLGVIPAGSGNDFVKCIGAPESLAEAIEVVLGNRLKAIDIGTVTFGNAKGNKYFFNGLGIGFDAAVANTVQMHTALPGFLRYLSAVIQTLGKYDAPEYTVTIGGEEMSDRYLLIAVGNGPCAGGGFYLTPDARCDDGNMDICLIRNLSIPRILMIMPSVMKGKHTAKEQVKMATGNHIKVLVSSSSTVFVHLDGEVHTMDGGGLEIGVLRNALRVLC